MKKPYFLTLFILATVFLYNSCEKDDICAESTPTTPKLVIVFKDINNRTQVKEVKNLNVRAEGEPNFYFTSPVTDTLIKIPLRTTENTTDYEFYINVNSSDTTALPNLDRVKFSYSPEDIYISRACGYKVNFIAFNATKINESNGENWIKDIEVQQPNDIVDEATPHLYIYH